MAQTLKQRTVVVTGDSADAIATNLVALFDITNFNKNLWSGASKIELRAVVYTVLFRDVTAGVYRAATGSGMIQLLDTSGNVLNSVEAGDFVAGDFANYNGVSSPALATAKNFIPFDSLKEWNYKIDVSAAGGFRISQDLLVPVGVALPASYAWRFRIKLSFDIYINR